MRPGVDDGPRDGALDRHGVRRPGGPAEPADGGRRGGAGAREPRRAERARCRRGSSAALAAVGLGGLDARDPMTLSGGEQQRLAIACAVAMRPSVLVMDEPTANLDPAGSDRGVRDRPPAVPRGRADRDRRRRTTSRRSPSTPTGSSCSTRAPWSLDGAPRDVFTPAGARPTARRRRPRSPRSPRSRALLDAGAGTAGPRCRSRSTRRSPGSRRPVERTRGGRPATCSILRSRDVSFRYARRRAVGDRRLHARRAAGRGRRHRRVRTAPASRRSRG